MEYQDILKELVFFSILKRSCKFVSDHVNADHANTGVITQIVSPSMRNLQEILTFNEYICGLK